MKWYKRYPGDFQSATNHLSLLERGAYTALLDHYYSTERPLPPDGDTLFRIAGAVMQDEQEAVRRIAAEFFPMNGDGHRHNRRADEEIEKVKAKGKANAKGGRARARSMSHKERQEAARKAAEARWEKERESADA